MRSFTPRLVMPALVAGIHVLDAEGADGRDICANARKTRFALLPGHDDSVSQFLFPMAASTLIGPPPAVAMNRQVKQSWIASEPALMTGKKLLGKCSIK